MVVRKALIGGALLGAGAITAGYIVSKDNDKKLAQVSRECNNVKDILLELCLYCKANCNDVKEKEHKNKK